MSLTKGLYKSLFASAVQWARHRRPAGEVLSHFSGGNDCVFKTSTSKAILFYLYDLDICPFWLSTLQPSAFQRWMWTIMPAQRAYVVRLPDGSHSLQWSGHPKLTREPTSQKSPIPALSWTLRTWPWRLCPYSTMSRSTTHTPVWLRITLPKPQGISKWQVGFSKLFAWVYWARIKHKLKSNWFNRYIMYQGIGN